MDRYSAAVVAHSTAGCPYRSTGRPFSDATATLRPQETIGSAMRFSYNLSRAVEIGHETRAIFPFEILITPAVALPVHATSESTGRAKTDSGPSLNLDEVGCGVKSAAKHIEEEILKIGPAVGKAFKHVTGREKEAGKPKEAPQRSTKPKT